MNAECRPEVCGLVKGMFEAIAKGVAVSTDEICLHLHFTDHSISVMLCTDNVNTPLLYYRLYQHRFVMYGECQHIYHIMYEECQVMYRKCQHSSLLICSNPTLLLLEQTGKQ